MARIPSHRSRVFLTLAAWGVAFLIFFPILWIVILSFKTEGDAIKAPLAVLTAPWTFESYFVVNQRSDYPLHFWNSVVISLGSTLVGLVGVLMLGNLPIIIWRLYTYFREIPGEILEATRMDGAGLRAEIIHVLTPMALPGIASTLLLNVILAWNEAFWTLNLTAAKAAPLTAFIASNSSPEGLFYAKLSTASTMAIAPILILGWFSQKQLVRGLTFGAVK